jgi:5-methylcytosine-specific restriction endonuclease McrA
VWHKGIGSMADQIVRAPKNSSARNHRCSDRRWRELAAKFRAYCAPRKFPCWLCTEPIDYQLRTGPWCFETDHAKPRKTFPHLMFEWSNLRPSHRRCNRARQDKPIVLAEVVASDANVVVSQQDWVRPTW